jgi:hypothetical protein
MAKFKTTSKEFKNQYGKIIRVGYCEIQYLLYNESAAAYNAGVYGWNYDVYTFGGVAIVTGYRPVGEYRVDYKKTRELEEKARKLWSYKNKWSHKRKQAHAEKLIREFIEAAE